MDAIFPDSVKAALLGVLAAGFALSWLARTHPEVRWLQFFRLPVVQLSEEERAKRRRMANLMAGLELIAAGLALPLVYVFSTVMMFNNFKTVPTVIVAVCSLACIGIGIWIFVRNLRPEPGNNA